MAKQNFYLLCGLALSVGLVSWNTNVFYSNVQHLVAMQKVVDSEPSLIPPKENENQDQFPTTQQEQQSNKSKKPKKKKIYENTKDFEIPSGLLPKKLYLVVGLESSGTNFVADILAKALKSTYTHDYFGKRQRGKNFWIQHMSLPSGPSCEKFPVPHLQKAMMPGACSDWNPNELVPTCRKLAEDAGIEQFKGRPVYNKRHFLDISFNKEWYESLGVEVVTIIVIRDQNVARIGRIKNKYCRNETLMLQEEAFGTEIINRAINKYIMGEDDDDENDDDEATATTAPTEKTNRRKLSVDTFDSWYHETFGSLQAIHDNATTSGVNTTDNYYDAGYDEVHVENHRRMLRATNASTSNIDDYEDYQDVVVDYDELDVETQRRMLRASLPHGNNVFLVSYESLMRLQDVYVTMLYEALGIESDYMPQVCDGNKRYVWSFDEAVEKFPTDLEFNNKNEPKQKRARRRLKAIVKC